MIKPASSLCNMQCRYCFYGDVSSRRRIKSHGIMSFDCAEGIIANTFKDLNNNDEVTFAFQGGEPTLAGLAWFENFTLRVSAHAAAAVKVHYAIQTNGLLIDAGWCAFFKAHNFLVGLSLDAGARFHDRNRVDAEGRGTWQAVMQCKALLESSGVEYNILCVLTNELAKEPDKIWRFIRDEKIRYIQFIPCLEEMDDDQKNPLPLRPPRFAGFYSRLLYRWQEELEEGSFVSVKFFDDTANYFFRGIPAACGINGQCGAQYVVESDGSVYPCDFYMLDEFNTGNLCQQTLREIFESDRMQSFLREKHRAPGICGTCGYRKQCGGGCKRMQNAMYYGAGGFCGFKSFLDKNLKTLENTVRRYFP